MAEYDDDEYYRSFLDTLRKEEYLPSDDEEFLAVEEKEEEEYHFKVPRAELVDLVISGNDIKLPAKRRRAPNPIRPLFPLLDPATMSRLFLFTREQRVLLLTQLEQFVQLLVQAVLLGGRHRTELLAMLRQLTHLSEVEGRAYNIAGLVPAFRGALNVKKQQSIFQVPLLELARQLVHSEHRHKRMARGEVRTLLSEFAPALINCELLPLDLKTTSHRVKDAFTPLDDVLLVQSLHMTKNPAAIQDLWLPHKSIVQIKNRIKNLKSKKYRPRNEIQKRIMQLLDMKKQPFSPDELRALQRGLTWFQPQRLPLVQKYFLPHRSLHQIEGYERTLSPKAASDFERESLETDCRCFCTCAQAFEKYALV